MSSSYSVSETVTFTITHARYLASKVATDLKRIQRLYNTPTDIEIADYEAEITELLKEGYLGSVIYGFKRGNTWIEPTLRYTAKDLADMTANDDDPGRIRPGANIISAFFCSYLSYSSAWHNLPAAEKETFKKRLPFDRSSGDESGISGYFSDDKVYSTGGRALNRSTLRSY